MARKRPGSSITISTSQDTTKRTQISLSQEGLLELLRKAGLPLPTDVVFDFHANESDVDPDPYLVIEWKTEEHVNTEPQPFVHRISAESK